MQLPLFKQTLWTVSQITRYIRELLEAEPILQDIWLQGEVSNFTRASSGHIYLTLKDSGSAIKCVMWRSSVTRQTILPHDGEAVEVHGNISLYEPSGQYQLYIDLIRPAGQGILYQEFLRLKARLEQEGLFDTERKRAIPRWPKVIGVVTSPTGAAIQDILNPIQRRFPVVKVVIGPTQVQGETAPAGIVNAINELNQFVHPDVIILARGGGSIEDLWAFNDERVARAIFGSDAPVISGVGHETDFTIADFTSDLRAPTPTAAAEMATPNRFDLNLTLKELISRVERAIQNSLSNQHWQFERLDNRLKLRSPDTRIRSDRQRLDDLTYRAALALTHQVQLEKSNMFGLQRRLMAVNPTAVLARGYALVRFRTGEVIRSVSQVSRGDLLAVQVNDGQFAVIVEDN